jgi:hypothetical protein
VTAGFSTEPVCPLFVRESKAFDMDTVTPEKTEKGHKGIYEIEGDTLRFCTATPAGAERPKTFESKEKSGNVLYVLKRVKDQK